MKNTPGVVLLDNVLKIQKMPKSKSVRKGKKRLTTKNTHDRRIVAYNRDKYKPWLKKYAESILRKIQ